MDHSTQHGMGEQELLGGRFQVEREVGRGAVGVVYRAYDTITHRVVALKLIATKTNEADEARFHREGSLLEGLDHPGIVRVVAHGTFDDGTAYIAMEWLDGEDLSSRQRRQPLTLAQALDVGRRVALALDAAHAAGVVHRDVKPSNIFVLPGPAGSIDVRLVDFGVAAAGDIRLTGTGGIVGTPAYMAPEQARGDAPVDLRCDLYGLGATMFELIVGRPPHAGPTPIATLARLVTTPAPRPSEYMPEIAPRIDSLLGRLLAFSANDRPSSAYEVAEELSEILSDPAALSVSSSRPSEPPSMMGSSGSRLVTSIVALGVGTGEVRDRAMAAVRAKDGDAAPLGQDAVAVHLGARQAIGDEAGRALDMGLSLAKGGARVGVATGRTRVRQSRPVGEVVDRAAAMAREAISGQVLADATTTELARGRFDFQIRPGGSAFVREAKVTRRTEGIGGSPFVGREPEMAQILTAYERCVDEHSPVVVTCSGPPGIGKTRLRKEVLSRIIATMTPPRLVTVRCESFGRTYPLGVAAEVLRSLVGLSRGISVQQAARAIEARLGGTLTGTDDPGRALVAQLLADEPLSDRQGARDALWLAMTDIIVRAAASSPTAVIIEDVQWADPESARWLDHILARARGKSLFLLLLARPTFFKEHARAFIGRDHVKLELRPVSKRAARTIARAIMGEKASDEIVELIATQAAGSPLFAEELARLSAAGRDATKAPTIEAAIQASIDTLEDQLRDAIARLSTFGMSGWEPGLASLGVPQAGGVLRQLAAAELVVEQAETRFSGATEWAFKHALVREVAYASLDPDAKPGLHAKAAVWLETMGEDSATVARHYELGDELEAAGRHWERAARRALATNALTDALSMAERALGFANDKATSFARALVLDEAFGRLDARASERETAIRSLLENVYDEASEVRAAGAQARYDDARGAGEQIAERLAAVRDRAERLGLVDEEARVSAALAARWAYAGRLAEAAAEAERLLSLAERKNIVTAAVDAWQTLAIVRQTRGELLSALDARRNAARAAASAGLKEREATLTINVGFALTTIGARQEARAAIEQGIAIAQSIGSAGVVTLGKMVMLGWAATFGSDSSLDPMLAEARAEADAASSGGWVPHDRTTLGVLFYRGLELLRQGGHECNLRARSLLKIATEAYRATGMRDLLPVAMGEWAEAERRCGSPQIAANIALEAAKLLEAGAPSLLNEAPVYLTLHDALVDAERPREAREAIARAIAPLARRLAGLGGSSYALSFLAHLPHNASLISCAETYGLLPRQIEALLERAVR